MEAIRQIVKINYTIGSRRLPGERISIKNSIRGSNDKFPLGVRRFVANFESVAFAPWDLYGFRFAFFSFADLGFITPEHNLFSPDHFYGVLGLGCRIRNESLVFKTIQFRIGYFLRAPDGFNRWNYDISSKEVDIFKNIQISKPSVIGFE